MLNFPDDPSGSDAKPVAADDKLRDAARSRQGILAAACEEFAEHGLGGSRVDRIAQRAGVNKRLIYYYFQDKDALFRAVLEQAYVDIRSAERELDMLHTEPTEAIRRLVAFTWHYYLENPHFLTLLNSANLHKARHLAGDANAAPTRAQALNSPLIETLADVLERGRKDGSFRGGIDPVQLYVSIAGLAYFYLSNQHTLGTIFGRDWMGRKALSERLSHMTEVILGYVLRSD